MEQTGYITISKSGPNLLAKIPEKDKDKISRGDKVKIILIEKAPIINKEKIKLEIKEFLKNPNGEKLKGTILGYPVEIPMARIINSFPKQKVEKLFYNSLLVPK